MKDATRAVMAGRDPAPDPRFVNPPVYHASTILFDGVEDMRASGGGRPGDGLSYAVHGTPGTYALEQALAELEGGYRTRLCNTGAQALSGPLLSFLSAGEHVLIPDSCYGNTRQIADGLLARLGIAAEFYDPLIGAGIAGLMRPETRLVFTESPGSQTFEVQDVPAIAAAAHARGALVALDNTWAGPLYFRPFEHGVDISINALTKYVAGHADLVMGAVTVTEAAYDALQRGWYELGLSASPDDAYLALRGVRTMPLRMERHWASGLALADWLAGREEVAEVIHPAMPCDPGHALWARDFRGAGGLFAFTLRADLSERARVAAFVDGLARFGIGFSWGGFQSMIMPVTPRRSATPWPKPGREPGQTMRIFAGLEDPEDLIRDLEAGLERLGAAL